MKLLILRVFERLKTSLKDLVDESVAARKERLTQILVQRFQLRWRDKQEEEEEENKWEDDEVEKKEVMREAEEKKIK